MGIYSCCKTATIVDYTSEISSTMFMYTEYKDIVTLVLNSGKERQNDAMIFQNVKDKLLNRKSSHFDKTEKIFDNFLSREDHIKINYFDILIFCFPVTKHEDEIYDFFQLVINYDRKPNEKTNKSLDRNVLKKVLGKLVYYHTEFMLCYVDSDAKLMDHLDKYKKKFTKEKILKYVENMLNDFDLIMKRKNSRSLLLDKSYFFTLEDIKLCLYNKTHLYNEKTIFVDLESYVDSHLS